MIRLIVCMLYVLLPLYLSAQNKWGYAAASFKVPANSGFMEILFISKAINLGTLSCRTVGDNRLDSKKIPEDELLARCICDWFYKRIGHTYNKALALIDKDNIYGHIELYSNFPAALKKRLKNPPPDLPTIFMHKKMARKRRADFITLAYQFKSIVVEID